MNHRTTAWLAWSLWAFSLALTALSLVLLVLNLPPWRSHLLLLGRECVVLGRLLDSGRSHSSPHACREPYRLAFLRDGPLIGSTPFHWRVCYLHAASGTRIAPCRWTRELGLHLRPTQ